MVAPNFQTGMVRQHKLAVQGGDKLKELLPPIKSIGYAARPPREPDTSDGVDVFLVSSAVGGKPRDVRGLISKSPACLIVEPAQTFTGSEFPALFQSLV